MKLTLRGSSLAIAGSLILLTGACSSTPTTTAPTTEPAASSPASSPTAASPTATHDKTHSNDIDGLKHHLQEALASAKANNLKEAQKHFQEFDETWDAVEDGVKQKSKDTYTAIETGMDEVKTALVRPAQPDQKKAIAALEALGKTLNQRL